MSPQQYVEVGRYHYYLPIDVKAAMRQALRDGLKNRKLNNIAENNLAVDCVLEQVWNAAIDNMRLAK